MKFLMVPLIVTVVFLLNGGVSGVEIGSLPNLQHAVSGTLHILDERTIYIEDFNYDGGGPGTWFYYYLPGVSANPSSGEGHKIPLSTEFGKSDGSLKSVTYTNVDITATLPDGVDACDIGTFTVWCEPFTVFFSTIVIPTDIFVNNGVGDDCALVSDTTVTPAPPEFDNCAVLSDKLQVSWRVHTDTEHMRFRLCGCQSIVSSTNQYMGFGVSGANNVTQMLGADPTIAWVDPMDGAQAVDYYLSAYTQCREGKGACPDTLDSSGSCTNDVFDVEGSVEDGVQCVSFTRNYSTSDSVCDKAINPSNANQYIVWAVGGYGETAFKHFVNAQSTTSPIHLGRTPADNCTGINLNCPSCSPFVNQKMIAREDTVFEVTVGPSGNERGYMGITGRAGWGISFFVNGTMIPELTVERGRTYKFLIRGGTDPNNHPNYHPLYISNSIGGGRLANTAAEQANETVYAGINGNGEATAVGDLCQLSESGSSQSTRESCTSDLDDYISTLTMSDGCESGQPGELIWTPNDTTPDLVYYQCAVHLNLGWKINVEDNSATEPPPTGSTPGPTSDSTPDPTPDSTPEPPPVIDNCIVFSDQLQLSWKVNQTFSNIRFKLCGCHSRTSEYNQYMAFGISGSPLSVEMLGGDVTLAWVDTTDGPQALDYYLSGRLPCNSEGSGVCPDTLDSSGSCTNDVFDVEGSVEDGVQCVSFTRKLTTSDSNCDTGIDPDEVIQYVIWAIGKYDNNQAQYHSNMRSKGTNSRIHFGRTPSDECAGIDIKCQSCSTFMNKKINASDGDASFEITVGPSAKERGYAGITGLEGGDVAFYINGSLIPELTLQRGNSYTFLVNGGYDSSNPSQYYQFYITDSTSGGSSANGESFAMIDVNSNADDNLCQLLESTSSAYVRESCSSLESYISTLTKSESCSSSRPVMVTWTPDNDTPDLVYYQSANHQYMGWRINIVGNSTMGSSAQSGQMVVCLFLLIILIASAVLLLV